MTSEHMISLVRKRLANELSSGKFLHMSASDYRRKLVERFCFSTSKKRSLDHVDIWAFLDSVLDENFQELETHIVYRGAEPSSNLIPTIVKRSPNLKKLKLNYKFAKYWDNPSSAWEPLICPLVSLHNLTSLTLYHLNSDYEPILSLIGKACPSLSHLCLKKGSHTTKHDILAILLGELVTQLIGPPERFAEHPYWRFKTVDWAEDNALGRLIVPTEFLSPLCFTLRHLELLEPHSSYSEMPVVKSTTAAFVLRHMPLLEKLEFCSGTEKGIQLLHKQTEDNEKSPGIFQEGFQQACRDVIQLHGLSLHNAELIVKHHSFSGTLLLTKLEYVHIQDAKIANLLRAIGLTCPFLKDVTFGEKKREDALKPSWYRREAYGEKVEDAPLPSKGIVKVDTSPKHLELALRNWAKLETITFIGLSPEYIRAILNVFHKDLKELSFVGCKLINLADLKRCDQLQSLSISSSCSLDCYDIIPALSADPFLPNLKVFECKICLGGVSSLFENKSTLIRLVMKCCHMDVQECIEFKWRFLESLHLQRCSGLVDMSMVSNLIDGLEHLKELFLYMGLSQTNEDNDLERKIRRNATFKPTPVNLDFKFYRNVCCLLDPMKDEASYRQSYANQMIEDADSPPSFPSDESARSMYSTTDYDPDESYDGNYYESDD